MGSDRFMEDLDACPSRLAAANARIAELESEIDSHRATHVADEDRVRGVIEAVAIEEMPNDRAVDQITLAGIIAYRAAKQLASAARPAPLSEDEVKQLRHHIATYRATCANSCALIERLLDTVRP